MFCVQNDYLMSGRNERIFFVNKKCFERLEEKANQLRKEVIEAPPVPHETKFDQILSFVGENQTSLFEHRELFPAVKVKPVETPKLSELVMIHPFLFGEIPPSCPETAVRTGPRKFNETRRKFLLEARKEHQRVLWTFQDGVLDDGRDEKSSYISAFTKSMDYLAEEESLNTETPPEPKPPFIRRMRELTSTLLNRQSQNSKLLRDCAQFVLNFNKTTMTLQSNPPLELQPIFPYAFLQDQN